ncbi:hypothetical protein ACSSZE_15900 [Acidithiobacillus caldus]
MSALWVLLLVDFLVALPHAILPDHTVPIAALPLGAWAMASVLLVHSLTTVVPIVVFVGFVTTLGLCWRSTWLNRHGALLNLIPLATSVVLWAEL